MTAGVQVVVQVDFDVVLIEFYDTDTAASSDWVVYPWDYNCAVPRVVTQNTGGNCVSVPTSITATPGS